jgi:hypothetical protein
MLRRLGKEALDAFRRVGERTRGQNHEQAPTTPDIGWSRFAVHDSFAAIQTYGANNSKPNLRWQRAPLCLWPTVVAEEKVNSSLYDMTYREYVTRSS